MCDFRNPPGYIKISDDEIEKVEYIGPMPISRINEINDGHIDLTIKKGVYVETECTGSGYCYYNGEHFISNFYGKSGYYKRDGFVKVLDYQILLWEHKNEVDKRTT